MPTYIADAVVEAKVKNLVKRSSLDDIPDFITDNITEYNQKAYNEIIAVLIGRGYTPAQIAGWDRGAEFNLDIATYWAISNAGVTEEFDTEEMNKLNRIAELATVVITVGGVLAEIELTSETTEYGTNYKMGTRAAYGTALNYDGKKYKPDRFDKFTITEFER